MSDLSSAIAPLMFLLAFFDHSHISGELCLHCSEKLAATKSSASQAKNDDVADGRKQLVGVPAPSPVTMIRNGVDLNRGLHQGMSDWDWRRRVDGRLDMLVRHTAWCRAATVAIKLCAHFSVSVC